MYYDYKQTLREDILEFAVSDGYNPELLDAINEDDKDRVYDILYEVCFQSDSITGNASGSYTMNSEEARENFLGDSEAQTYFEDGVEELEISAEELAEHFFDWEWIDVVVRISLLGEVLSSIIFGDTEKDRADYQKLVDAIKNEYGTD